MGFGRFRVLDVRRFLFYLKRRFFYEISRNGDLVVMQMKSHLNNLFWAYVVFKSGMLQKVFNHCCFWSRLVMEQQQLFCLQGSF